MTRFLLIRHGLTDAIGHCLAGRMDGFPLNEEGVTQAQHLAGQLAHLPINAIYSSPLQRAVETAYPLAVKLRIEPTILTDFNELDFGDWTNAEMKKLENDEAFRLFNLFRSGMRIPGGELMVEAQLRIIKGLEKLQLKHPGQTVAVVSHADMIRAAIAYYACIPLDLFQRLTIDPASVSVIELFTDNVRIVQINHTGRLRF